VTPSQGAARGRPFLPAGTGGIRPSAGRRKRPNPAPTNIPASAAAELRCVELDPSRGIKLDGAIVVRHFSTYLSTKFDVARIVRSEGWNQTGDQLLTAAASISPLPCRRSLLRLHARRDTHHSRHDASRPPFAREISRFLRGAPCARCSSEGGDRPSTTVAWRAPS
jgi:hypothetical protein